MTVALPEVPHEPGRAPRSAAEVVGQLEATWHQETGLRGWLRSVDHKSIGRRYILTAFLFFLLGGLEAAMMRAQLSRPENGQIGRASCRERV